MIRPAFSNGDILYVTLFQNFTITIKKTNDINIKLHKFNFVFLAPTSDIKNEKKMASIKLTVIINCVIGLQFGWLGLSLTSLPSRTSQILGWKSAMGRTVTSYISVGTNLLYSYSIQSWNISCVERTSRDFYTSTPGPFLF